ncbi:STAS domain-containing protein [Reyranella sp.]|uniref:STAS domain-containing protein n=1 Tax=Reyranella sp. TaxID=1929291 RepID=UPI003783740F
MTTTDTKTNLARMIADNERAILASWVTAFASTDTRISTQEVESQARQLLQALGHATASGNVSDIRRSDYGDVRDLLAGFSRSRAIQGFSPTETATFVLSLKQALFEHIRQDRPEDIAANTWTLSQLVDQLGLFTIEMFQKTREELIARQREEIEELSTPVVKLWDGIVALPLIGALDSARTQVVMQNLLEAIVQTGAEIAILDITGVPTVDTLVAQHLLKTVSAARLMGADCIISGIRPQIAQTIVQLGVQLNVISKATLADAFALALQRTNRTVVRIKHNGNAKAPGVESSEMAT